MKKQSVWLALTLLLLGSVGHTQNLGTDYTKSWKDFYPSRATTLGHHEYIFHFEAYDIRHINNWIDYNRARLSDLEHPQSAYAKNFPINTRLLRQQMRKELDRWEREQPHIHDLNLYARSLRTAWSNVLQVDYLSNSEKGRLLCQRLQASEKLIEATLKNLSDLNKRDAQNGLNSLQRLQSYLGEDLLEEMDQKGLNPACLNFTSDLSALVGKIKDLETYVKTELIPQSKEQPQLLGREEYNRQLDLYTDGQLRSEELEKITLEEIEETKRIIKEVSRTYLLETYPTQEIPEKEWISRAFADMEKDAPKNGAEYKVFWLDLAAAAIDFIKEHDIATLPAYQTLRIENAPESAGAAARIGWVDSAAPFAPNPVTTLYLPSIPDTLPEQEQIDFWSSFNKPFNRMIVIHELFPGHYMQIKISRETPHPLRLFFPYSPYIEGWATFTEKVLLDAGWEKERKLTYLAHLRKRLENANRAYTSVQVHCNGWTQEQVMQFSTEMSLLAPQFAKSLWGRIMRSPMQLTSYFWGGKQFKELLEREQERLGDRFELKRFMDTIMQAGPIPIDAFDALFQSTTID